MKNFYFTDNFSISQPYKPVSGGHFSGKENPFSPDPLENYIWANPKADDPLQIFIRTPVSISANPPSSFSGIKHSGYDRTPITVTGKGTLVLDFGSESAGWLEIDSPDMSGIITLGISEYNAPAFVNKGPKSPSKTAVPNQYGNSYRLELNDELYEGVRFGFINVEDFEKPFTITDIRLICQVKPVNYKGSFDSDSEMLNKIWYTGAYAVRLNLRQDYFSAILMDRGDRYSWTGDAYTAQAAALTAFGNYDFILHNLQHTSQHSNGIESYELYWIFSLIDYYMHTGDKNGVCSLLPEAIKRLEHAYDIYGTNPHLAFFGWDERLGAGFENPNLPDNQLSYKFLSIRAWKEFAKVLKDLGEVKLCEKYLGYAREKTAQVNLEDQNFGIHAAADAINAGLVSPDDLASLYKSHFSDRLSRLSYSPFNQCFILQAMARCGEYDDGISCIYDMWGEQIKYGATAFFESFRPCWNDIIEPNSPVPNNQAGYTSLAHAWGAGVVSWISGELLGIKPQTPGFKTFSIKPHMGRHLTRVSGHMPTPFGPIYASFNAKSGECLICVPESTKGLVGIPKSEMKITGLLHNGKPAKVKNQDEKFIYVQIGPGRHSFLVSYSGSVPKYTLSPYIYKAQFMGMDTVTKGNWVNKYGKDGYLLCSYGDNDEIKLPPYVEFISFNKAENIIWSVDTLDERALISPCSEFSSRKIGAKKSKDNEACFQTFTADIKLKFKKEYTVALYFVDWNFNGRETAVEMFDLDTLDMIAPVTTIKNSTQGVYIIYQYNGSARFRINHIRGDNVVLNGIFFGTPEKI